MYSLFFCSLFVSQKDKTTLKAQQTRIYFTSLKVNSFLLELV